MLKKPQWIETFERALDMTRGFWIAREATLYMYEEIVAILRDCAERLAARLVAEGKIRHTRDLYYLPVNELEDIIAVVTDTGGVLSHSAIVAREYGIPAVMACGNATKVLSDGDRVIVNGTTGIVHRVR
ncbi:hypothetical protein LQV63_26550 [Paenibacillus profundus]|uniref:PEP-utilising enzyme mobile domain-containing protein n=1 Tax=Paenibacillus profundus TaxID=1173085 RepID=A0ABS8YLX2_9BACL|nr:PEP-utilizing enzyme [Paenibacillus profundus]MCE5172833.1 hypothetical protein [Paenibacillus profundus]